MATYKSSYTGPQIDQAVSHAVNMDVNPTAGHTDRVVSSGGVKSAITPLDGILVTNASLLQTLASAQLKEHSVTALRTNYTTTDTPYTGYFIGWAVKYGQNINVQVCDMFNTVSFVNSSQNNGTSWYGWTRVVQARDIAGIHVYSNTNTTGAIISSGTYFYFYDNLVQAIADIAVNAAFTLNTNYKVITAGGLNELKSAISASVISRSAISDVITVSAYGSYDFSIPIPVVSGYTPFVVVPTNACGSFRCYFTQCQISGDNIVGTVGNWTSQAVAGQIVATVIYIKS